MEELDSQLYTRGNHKPFLGEKVRLDKWLWAARFFKTRNLAKQAIEGGKIQCDGNSVKAAKEITAGVTLRIRQGLEEKTILVLGLNDQRRAAPEAVTLYQETEESIQEREKRTAERKAGLGSFIAADHRPSKKDRRQIHRFQRINLFSDE